MTISKQYVSYDMIIKHIFMYLFSMFLLIYPQTLLVSACLNSYCFSVLHYRSQTCKDISSLQTKTN